MDAASLPVWAQTAGTIAIAIIAAVVGVLKYIKTETKPASNSRSGEVLSASFIDSRMMRELIEALREHQEESGRDIKRLLRAVQDLRETLIENNEALIVQTDTSTNMLKFITRLAKTPIHAGSNIHD